MASFILGIPGEGVMAAANRGSASTMMDRALGLILWSRSECAELDGEICLSL